MLPWDLASGICKDGLKLRGRLVSYITNIQRYYNFAIGFDRDGAKELKNLVGTNKWIGTSGTVVLSSA